MTDTVEKINDKNKWENGQEFQLSRKMDKTRPNTVKKIYEIKAKIGEK